MNRSRRNLCLTGLAVLLPLAAIFAPMPAAGEDVPGQTVLNLFYAGNRFSQLEPCGCKSKQKGGVQYEAALYAQHADAPSVRLDAGNWTMMNIERSPVAAMKTRYLLRAFSSLGMDGVNIGLSDLQLRAVFFETLKKKNPEAVKALISANVYRKAEPGQRAFAPSRIIEREGPRGTVRIGLTGATSNQLSAAMRRVPGFERVDGALHAPDFVVRDPLEHLAPVIEALEAASDLLVVLFAGDLGETGELVRKFPQIDFVVTSAPSPSAANMMQPIGETVVLHFNNIMGRELGYVPVESFDDKDWSVLDRPESLFVTLDLPIDDGIMGLIEEFKVETRTLEATPPADAKNIYGGAYRCARCHEDIYQDWTTWPHAQALQTLVDRGQQFNPECLKCHVVGYKHENGFYSVQHGPSRRLGGVQCENCHGPSLEHANAQLRLDMMERQGKTEGEQYSRLLAEARAVMPRRDVPAEYCITCHDEENDDNFVYEVDVQKVNHSRVLKAARQETSDAE